MFFAVFSPFSLYDAEDAINDYGVPAYNELFWSTGGNLATWPAARRDLCRFSGNCSKCKAWLCVKM